MFEKNLKLAYLLDFYGDVLDEHTRGVMKAYYDDDLSLSEIAEGVGISRQGVRHLIKKGEEQLEFLETRLGLAEQYERLSEKTTRIIEIKDVILKSRCEGANEAASLLSEVIGIIESKG